MFRIILFLTLLGIIHCVPVESKWISRIINGVESHKPYVLQLAAYNGRLEGFCTASLITQQLILTAAHCYPPAYGEINIIYGCFYVNSPNCKRVKVIQWILYPSYVPSDHVVFGDIAVAKLEYELDGITPIALPASRNMHWTPSGWALAVGYGKTENGNPTDHQLAKDMNIPEENPIRSLIIVPESPESGTLAGDSGGPLIIDDTIYGVLSGGVDKKYAMYMSVNYFRGFIETSIQQLENSNPQWAQ